MNIRQLDSQIADLRESYNQDIGRLRSAEERHKNLTSDKEDCEALERMYREELAVILSAGARQLEIAAEQLSSSASYAVQKVFGGDYTGLTIETDASGTSTIAKILLHKHFGEEIESLDPFEDDGGGINDVISGILKFSALNCYEPFVENAFIADEMTKHVSEEYREAFAVILRDLSHQLNRQIILSTHDPALAISSDNLIRFDY